MSSLDERIGILGYLAQNSAPGWIGRTALMKLCYFLQEICGVPLGYRFTLYSYGPFDSAVLGDLANAEAFGVLREDLVYYPSGPGYQITCVLDPRQVAELAGELLDDHQRDIDWVIREFGGRSAADLELVSTLVYIDREAHNSGERISMSELTRRVREIKPRFRPDYIFGEAESLVQNRLLTATT